MNIRTTFTHQVPSVIYCVLGLGFFAQGLRYLGATELMPYHMDVIRISWDQLAPDHQQLFLGLLRGFGAGSLSTGVAVILLTLVPLRMRQPWAYRIIPLVSVVYIGAITYVTTSTLAPGAIPIGVSWVFMALALLAWGLSTFRVRALDIR